MPCYRRVLVALAIEATCRHIERISTQTSNRELMRLLLSLLMISIEGVLSKDSASAKACLCRHDLATAQEMTWCARSINHVYGTRLTVLH